ncbi:hypothetical protein Bca4012_067210 [Brassica carinata]
MQNEEGQITEPLHSKEMVKATNMLITSEDHASVQLNIGHLNADGMESTQPNSPAFLSAVLFVLRFLNFYSVSNSIDLNHVTVYGITWTNTDCFGNDVE